MEKARHTLAAQRAGKGGEPVRRRSNPSVIRAASLALLLAAGQSPAADEGRAPIRVEVVGTAFRMQLANGEYLEGQRVLGTVITVGDADGTVKKIRLDEVIADPRDPAGEITLYRLSAWDERRNSWQSLCSPDADGFAGGFPLSGTWTPAREHRPSEDAFALTCTSGVNAKCARMGYKPWKTTENGIALWNLHQACTRMLRADYCGDGTPHTKDGTPVEIYDTLGIQTPEAASGLSFEAVWGPDGALCVRKPRHPDLISLEALITSCPHRLAGRVGENCVEEQPTDGAVPLIFNRS